MSRLAMTALSIALDTLVREVGLDFDITSMRHRGAGPMCLTICTDWFINKP